MKRSTFLKQLLGGAAAVGVGATLDIELGEEPEASTVEMKRVSGTFEISDLDGVLREGYVDAKAAFNAHVREHMRLMHEDMVRRQGVITGITTS